MARRMDNGPKKDTGSKAKRRRRRSFTDELKAGAVGLVLDEDEAIGRVARERDLTPSALGL